ncbi:MAG: zinc-binding dehydrogenase [Verrucomicrobia bacterium]|nr:zinc-binding dehydrogenase [Verrucomicrobiota bacterium]
MGVIGIGGLGHLAIQFSHALGCHTTALSHSASKQKEAKELGADQFLPLNDLEQAKGTFDFILSTVNQPLEWPKIMQLLRPRGILCLVGRPLEPMMITPGNLIDGAKVLCGSSIGSRAAIKEMLEFSARNHIAARVEVFPMNQVNEAIAKVRSGDVRYRMVLQAG